MPFDGATHQDFTLSLGVDIRCVEKVYAKISSSGEELEKTGRVALKYPAYPCAPEPELRHDQIGLSEGASLHA
jgi:hypothetical protein